MCEKNGDIIQRYKNMVETVYSMFSVFFFRVCKWIECNELKAMSAEHLRYLHTRTQYTNEQTQNAAAIFNQFQNAHPKICMCDKREHWTMQIVHNWYQFHFNWKLFRASFYPIIHCCWMLMCSFSAHSFNRLLLLNNNHIWRAYWWEWWGQDKNQS